MRLNLDKHLIIKISEKSFAHRFAVGMTSFSNDKIKIQRSNICGERCDVTKNYQCLKKIVSRGWNPIACSGSCHTRDI